MVANLNTGTPRHLILSFEIEGEKQISAGLDYVGKELKDFRKPLKKSSELLLKTWEQNFDAQGSTLGEPWQRLSPKYAAWKAKRYPGKGILVRTGKMRKSFRDSVTSVSATLTNPTPYFRYHQSNASRGTLPRRVMMKIDRQRVDGILRIFTEWLNEVASHFSKK